MFWKKLCSMYYDGLSSVTGKTGTWNTRKHQYENTLAESTTMVGDISLVYTMIKLWYVWCTGMHGLWMSRETSTDEADWCFSYSWNLIYQQGIFQKVVGSRQHVGLKFSINCKKIAVYWIQLWPSSGVITLHTHHYKK